MEETRINNWYFGGSTWWERRKLARLHSENKTSGGQSGMVWSVRFLDFFSLLFSLDCIVFPIPSFKRDGGMGGDTTHMSGYVLLLVSWFLISYLQVIVCAHSPASSSLGSLVSFNKWGREWDSCVCVLI